MKNQAQLLDSRVLQDSTFPASTLTHNSSWHLTSLLASLETASSELSRHGEVSSHTKSFVHMGPTPSHCAVFPSHAPGKKGQEVSLVLQF